MSTPFFRYIRTPYFIGKAIYRRLASNSFLHFWYHTHYNFIAEEIHVLMSEVYDQVAEHKLNRVMIHMSPRTGKSEGASIRFPAFYLGKHPLDHILHCSHTASFTKDFSRGIRALLQSDEYLEVFPDIRLNKKENAAEHWSIYLEGAKKEIHPGKYHAAGAGSRIAGRGFHLGIIDDALSEQDAFSDTRVNYINNWYGPGFYTRMQPERGIILMPGTRWRSDDLFAHVIKLGQEDPDFADKWTVIDIPAIIGKKMASRLNRARPTLVMAHMLHKPKEKLRQVKYKEGMSFAPRRHPLKNLKRIHAVLTEHYWQALYMQRPTKATGVIILRHYWKRWPYETPPDIWFLISCYDTAFEEHEETDNDCSARTTWGVFTLPDGRNAIILLDTWQDRLGFPDLREEVKAQNAHWKEDLILVEKRASGHSLIQELKRSKLPIQAWLPPGRLTGDTKKSRVRGKIPRTHAASIVFASGLVWVMPNERNEVAITQSAAFPFGDLDDVHDTNIMAALYLRDHLRRLTPEELSPSGGLEEDDDDDFHEPPRTKRQARLQKIRRRRVRSGIG